MLWLLLFWLRGCYDTYGNSIAQYDNKTGGIYRAFLWSFIARGIILRQLAAHGVTLIALPMTNLLLQDATFGRTPRQRGITLLHEAQAAGVATLLGCDNVQDAFCPAGSYDPLDTLACGLFSAQLSDLFDRQSRLICDRAALTGSPADAAPFAIGAAASVVIFPGSDRFTWPLNSAARLVVNHGRLTHRRVWQEEMAHES